MTGYLLILDLYSNLMDQSWSLQLDGAQKEVDFTSIKKIRFTASSAWAAFHKNGRFRFGRDCLDGKFAPGNFSMAAYMPNSFFPDFGETVHETVK